MFPVDWFPEDHPPLPEIVTHGRPPVARPCYACHTLNGKGKPENAPVAGLPKDYLIRQLREFKSGKRVGYTALLCGLLYVLYRRARGRTEEVPESDSPEEIEARLAAADVE